MFPSKALFIFRRDLRLVDNTTLQYLVENNFCIAPVFIFDPRQYEDNQFKSEHAFSFLLESLAELEEEISNLGGRLFTIQGIPEEALYDLLKANPEIKCVGFNRDYTPFSLMRDEAIRKVCNQLNVEVISFDDALIVRPDVIQANSIPLHTFSSFFKNAPLPNQPVPLIRPSFSSLKWQIFDYKTFFKKSLARRRFDLFQGGRKRGLELLRRLKSIDYSRRDFPAEEQVSYLSPHHKFGTISVRETFYSTNDASFRRQLYWRDFFTLHLFFKPKILNSNYLEVFDNFPWEWDEAKFQKWTQGETGFPIIDAGIRQLVQTGYMHNRVRLIVASFLCKDLRFHWKAGEKFFANHLVDYDPAVNNGNWQWCAGTGLDAMPAFRIFNPWLQQKKFDPDATYIKAWIPELKDLTASDIHSIHDLKLTNYPPPMIDHYEERAKTLKLVSNLKAKN